MEHIHTNYSPDAVARKYVERYGMTEVDCTHYDLM